MKNVVDKLQNYSNQMKNFYTKITILVSYSVHDDVSIYLSIYVSTYIATLQGNYSEALPAQARPKRGVLKSL